MDAVYAQFGNLNTSHVNLQQYGDTNQARQEYYLNTSHVNLQRKTRSVMDQYG